MMAQENGTPALRVDRNRQVLKREWNFWAVLCMSSVCLCTWEATSALFAGAYVNGGPASVVYGFIISMLGTLCIAASMAEMASISPVAGAQYHWSAEHAPRRIRGFVSWCQGWVTVVGWVAGTASLCFILATTIQGVAVLNYPTYDAKRWQVTLVMIGFAGTAALGTIFAKRLLPLWETLGGICHVLFFFLIMIALNASGQKASNKDVWKTFINAGGWGNDGVSFCLGFVTPAFALAGIDIVVHMSEETYDAPVNIPRAMIGSAVINGIAGFAYIITLLYCITDSNAVLTTPTGLPIIAVFQEATHNDKAVTAMMTAIIIAFVFTLFGTFASVPRLIWAFSRDNGLPFSRVFAYVSPDTKCPTYAVLLHFACVCILSLINIGSTTAFNALISLTSLGFYFSYSIPILMFAIRRFSTENVISFGPWTMGRLGLLVNILAICFCTFLIIFLPFPAYLPVTGSNMNYAAPVFLAVMLYALADYILIGHKQFTGPHVDGMSSGSTSNSGDVEKTRLAPQQPSASEV